MDYLNVLGQDDSLNQDHLIFAEGDEEDGPSSNSTSTSKSRDLEPIPPPSRRMMRMAQLFRLGLSLFLILSVLLGTMGCSTQAATPWKPAVSLIPETTLLELIKQQSSNLPDPQAVVRSMRGLAIEAREGKVVVLDFNNSGWCGTGGCYYPVYWLRDKQAPQLVLAKLLYPQLPPGKSLFQASESSDQPIPCLSTWQTETVNLTRLRQTQYCFNGQEYKSVSSSLFDTQQAAQ